MPLLSGFFSIYSLDLKFIWLPRPKCLKQEMTQHIPGIFGVKDSHEPTSVEQLAYNMEKNMVRTTVEC